MREHEHLMAHWLRLIILQSVEEGTHGGRRGEHPSLLAWVSQLGDSTAFYNRNLYLQKIYPKWY